MALSCTVLAAANVPTDNPASISADELHALLTQAHTTGNVARKRFIDALRALSEQRLYLQLGYPTVVAYAEAHFQCGKTQVYDFLRVSESLVELRLISAAFERGDLSWSLTSQLCRVAGVETEEEWLAFATERPIREVLAEIKDALKKNRKRPRRGSFGLPGLPVQLRFEFPPEEHAIVEKGLAKVAGEMSPRLDGAHPAPSEVLLYLMDRVLKTEPKDKPAERTESPYKVVFHRCGDCHRAAVETSAGRVEVSAATVDRFDDGLNRVEIAPETEFPPEKTGAQEAPPTGLVPAEERDRPNTPALRKALRARAGGRCENPHCRRQTEDGHGHHIALRSKGGATALWNETYVCGMCHSLVHAGLLRIDGDPVSGLKWTPRAKDSSKRVREELEAARTLTQVQIVQVPGFSGCAENEPPPGNSADAEKADAIAVVARALQKLKWTKGQALERAQRAWKRLSSERPRETIGVSELLKEAART